MKSILTIAMVSLLVNPVFAGPKCTGEPKEKWLDQKNFEKGLQEKGYKIKKFKVTDGNCYEIYGWDKAGKKVEIYHNPVTGEVVKEEKL